MNACSSFALFSLLAELQWQLTTVRFTFLSRQLVSYDPQGKTSSKKKPKNNGEMLLCFFALIGSICWQSSDLRSWKPALTLEFGPHSEVAWTDVISVQLSIQANCEPHDFAVDMQPLKNFWSVYTLRPDRGSKHASNQWSNSFKGVHGSCLNHSQSIFDFLSKNSHNKRKTADKTRFHDTAV